jgi:hypothetical protein
MRGRAFALSRGLLVGDLESGTVFRPGLAVIVDAGCGNVGVVIERIGGRRRPQRMGADLEAQIGRVAAHDLVDGIGREGLLEEVSGATSSDPGDTKFLQCAEAAQADYIVTGNKHDFPAGLYGVTRVVSAGELLDRITLEI